MQLTNGAIVDYNVPRIQEWGKPACWSPVDREYRVDKESIIYQQAVMKNVQNDIEVFIRHRIRLLVLSSF